MNCFFTLIYIVPNRFSDEKISVAILMNLKGIPYFAMSDRKLNFALNHLSSQQKSAIRKGFYFLDWDVNKIRNGMETMSLFDAPYAKKILKSLTDKKRGIVQYSDLFEINIEDSKKNGESIFESLFTKFIGDELRIKSVKKTAPNFKSRVKAFTSNKKYADFEQNFKLTADKFPFIYQDVSVDLCRKTNYYTVFYSIDFASTIQTIQNKISQFRIIVQSLQQVSSKEGLSSGRYYLVYESISNSAKRDIINRLINEENLGFSLIRLSEMNDKI